MSQRRGWVIQTKIRDALRQLFKMTKYPEYFTLSPKIETTVNYQEAMTLRKQVTIEGVAGNVETRIEANPEK